MIIWMLIEENDYKDFIDNLSQVFQVKSITQHAENKRQYRLELEKKEKAKSGRKSKLSDNEISAIKTMRAEKTSLRKIAEVMNVCPQTIANYLKKNEKTVQR